MFGVGVLNLVKLWEFALVRLRFGLALVRAKAMVEVMNHFCFVKGQIGVITAVEDVAVQFPAVGFQLFARAKQAGVRRHVEKALAE